MKAKSLLFLLVAAAAFSTGVAAAEDSTLVSRSYAVPGVSTEITAYTGVPEGFDPTTASDEDLQTYGFPRRPDPNDAKAYTMWARAVATERITPEFGSSPGVYHHPHPASRSASSNVEFENWSGYSLVGGSPKFDGVVGVWVVPNINTQSESFTGYSSMWVGIDGNCKCNDLIQDGTEQDWEGGKAGYHAWIEFLPETEVRITNFPVQPGDIIYAYSGVGVENGNVYGYYYLANYNTRKSFSGSLAMPKGDTFSGQTTEWIFERTEVNGSFQNPLPYYAYAYMDDAWAYRSGSNHAIDYSSETNENITMIDANGKPLSKAYAQDGDSMWFEWLAYK